MGDPTRMLTTYRLANGELIMGEFSWVTDANYLDEMEHDDPTEYIKEEWACMSRESIWRGPDIVCAECGDSHDYVTAGTVCCDG